MEERGKTDTAASNLSHIVHWYPPTSTACLQAEVEEFYFSHYCKHFGREHYRDALASTPSLMIWDDHDIFDGWGSYPTKMLNCDVMQVCSPSPPNLVFSRAPESRQQGGLIYT